MGGEEDRAGDELEEAHNGAEFVCDFEIFLVCAVEGDGGEVEEEDEVVEGGGDGVCFERNSGDGENEEGVDYAVLFSHCSAQAYPGQAMGGCMYITLERYFTLPSEGLRWDNVVFAPDEEGGDYILSDGELVYIDADEALLERVKDLFLFQCL